MNNQPASPPKSFTYNPPETKVLPIIYEDEHILVLSKPSGLLTVPGKAEEHADCLETRVQTQYPAARIIHRLDMDTSGIIIMALSKEILAKISRQFEKRHVSKEYMAKVFGRLSDSSGTVDLPLRCDWPNRPRQMVDHEEGKKAVTHWECISYDGNSTLVRLVPVTGRSHQLRVHMLTLGHPILGDNLYAHKEAFKASERLLLHATKLAITHPVTGNRQEFASECPF